MKYRDIVDAVNAGKTVCWSNIGYEVIKSKESFYITFIPNGYTVCLESEFYKADEPDFVDHSKFNDQFLLRIKKAITL